MNETTFKIVSETYLSSIVKAVDNIRKARIAPEAADEALKELKRIDMELWDIYDELMGGK